MRAAQACLDLAERLLASRTRLDEAATKTEEAFAHLQTAGNPVGETRARSYLVESELRWRTDDPVRGATASMRARQMARELANLEYPNM